MTALAVALVLCCAMACGTYLAKRRYDVREAEAHSGGVTRQLMWETGKGFDTQVEALKQQQAALAREVEQLRASSAFRSLS